MFTTRQFEHERLRVAFVVYGAINRKDWRTISLDDVRATPAEVRSQLIPTLRRAGLAGAEEIDAWVARLVAECRDGVASLLALTGPEREFLDRLLDYGEVDPTLLTSDAELVDRIRRHPGLEWKARNVRQFKGRKS